MSIHNNREFTTKDHDRDKAPANCAQVFSGAWWYNDCHDSNLNGLYPEHINHTAPKYMSWWKIDGHHGRIIFSEMKLKYSSSEL